MLLTTFGFWSNSTMPDEHRTTTNRRNARAGLVAIRIGGQGRGQGTRVFWVPAELARRIERLCAKAQEGGEDDAR